MTGLFRQKIPWKHWPKNVILTHMSGITYAHKSIHNHSQIKTIYMWKKKNLKCLVVKGYINTGQECVGGNKILLFIHELLSTLI